MRDLLKLKIDLLIMVQRVLGAEYAFQCPNAQPCTMKCRKLAIMETDRCTVAAHNMSHIYAVLRGILSIFWVNIFLFRVWNSNFTKNYVWKAQWNTTVFAAKHWFPDNSIEVLAHSHLLLALDSKVSEFVCSMFFVNFVSTISWVWSIPTSEFFIIIYHFAKIMPSFKKTRN